MKGNLILFILCPAQVTLVEKKVINNTDVGRCFSVVLFQVVSQEAIGLIFAVLYFEPGQLVG